MGNQKSGGMPNQAMGAGLSNPGNISMRFGRGVSATPAQQQVTNFGQNVSGMAQNGPGQNFGSQVSSMAQANGNAQAYGQANANGQQSSQTAYGMPAGASDVPLVPNGQSLPGGLTMMPGGGVSFANGDFMKPGGFQLGGMTWDGQQFQMPGLTMNTGANGQQPSINMNGQPMPNMNGLLGMFNRGSN